MGLFGNYKKNISKREFFKEVRPVLASKDFTKDERDYIEGIFHGDIEESTDYERGIDDKELERGLRFIREHMDAHTLTKEQIDILEEAMKRFLKN